MTVIRESEVDDLLRIPSHLLDSLNDEAVCGEAEEGGPQGAPLGNTRPPGHHRTVTVRQEIREGIATRHVVDIHEASEPILVLGVEVTEALQYRRDANRLERVLHVSLQTDVVRIETEVLRNTHGVDLRASRLADSQLTDTPTISADEVGPQRIGRRVRQALADEERTKPTKTFHKNLDRRSGFKSPYL